MTVVQDKPFMMLNEAGSDEPIIPIRSVESWREGGGKMSLVRFEDINGNKLSLSFDEFRLVEAIYMFTEATNNYPTGNIRPLFSAREIDIKKKVSEKGELFLINFRVSSSLTISIHLPKETLEQMKSAFLKIDFTAAS